MHIVIPVRVSRNNRSLPLALRTIATHTEYTPVLIGHNPGFDVAHVPTVQGRDKFANTERAMFIACTTAWISDPFVWSNDDIYWTYPSEPVRFAIGKLQDDTATNVYGKRKQLTLKTLRRLGYPTWDYESHTPMLIDKKAMLTALTLPGTMRSLYGNMTGLPTLVAPDVKLRSRTEELPTTPWVSTASTPTSHPELAALLV